MGKLCILPDLLGAAPGRAEQQRLRAAEQILAWPWVTACKRRSHHASPALRSEPVDLRPAARVAHLAIRRR
jgi:hypothetical protein